MIYCVWYPSGGFGHFVNAVLTLHGNNFVRPKNTLEFSSDGNSHGLDLVVPKYFKESWPGNFEFVPDKNYCVLIDNGINNESDRFKQTFNGAKVIKICYSDHSWPIVAKTMINKAMHSSIEQQLPVDGWDTDEPWARREKYFLFLRDHSLRHAWRPAADTVLSVDQLLDYNTLFECLNSIVEVEAFDTLWHKWRAANTEYIDPVQTAQKVITSIKHKQHCDLTKVTDVWTQSVIYYYVWITFGIEIPHNDFSNFFTNTEQIAELIT